MNEEFSRAWDLIEAGDDEGALQILERLYHGGLPAAAEQISYIKGRDVSRNRATLEDVEWWHWKAHEAIGDDTTRYHLALTVLNRYFQQPTSRSPERLQYALGMLREVADSGLLIASLLIGAFYFEGKIVDRDIIIAKLYLEKAKIGHFMLSYVYLRKIAVMEKRYISAAILMIISVFRILVIGFRNIDDPKLIGLKSNSTTLGSRRGG
jgi:hypothetical protein